MIIHCIFSCWKEEQESNLIYTVPNFEHLTVDVSQISVISPTLLDVALNHIKEVFNEVDYLYALCR